MATRLSFVFLICFLLASPLRGEEDAADRMLADFFAQIKRPKQHRQAEATANHILKIAKQNKDEILQARALCRRGYVRFVSKEGDWKSDLLLSEELSPAESLARAELLLFRGVVRIKRKDIETGIKDLDEGTWLAQLNHADDLLSFGYALQAEHLLIGGSIDRAMQYGYRGLTIAKDIDNPTAEYFNTVVLMRSFAAVGRKSEATDLARRLKQLDPDSVQADWKLIDSKDPELIASINNRIEKAVTDEAHCDVFELASNQMALAKIRKSQKKIDEAAKLFDLAKENYLKSGFKQNAVACDYQKVLMLYQHDHPKSSFKRLYQLANRPATPLIKSLIAEDMAKTLEDHGKFRQALHWNKQYIRSRNRLKSKQIEDTRKSAQSLWASELRSRKQQEEILRQHNVAWQTFLCICGLTGVGLGLSVFGLFRFRNLNVSRKELETLVDARTKSLRVAQEEAQRADNAKSEFLARVNHELRNPLTAILGYCELLEYHRESEQHQSQFLTGLRTSSQHLLDLVGEVLDVAKIAEGQIEVQQKNFDIAKICNHVSDILNPLANEKELEFVCDHPTECHKELFGDETILKQIMVNLVGNAIKFTNTGFVNASLETFDETETDVMLRLNVKDSGIGVSPENQVAIFSPFFQTKGANKEGKGLGLHICKCLVNHLGGTISLTSELGKGTQVVVEIPFCKASQSGIRINRLTNIRFQKRNILVVDDQQVIREVVSGQLNSMGHSAKACYGSIDHILEELEQDPPDLVLLDLRMPNQDGFEVFEAICKKFGPDRPIVVAMTGDATDFVKARVENCGFDEFLAKPFRVSKLNATLVSVEANKNHENQLRRSG